MCEGAAWGGGLGRPGGDLGGLGVGDLDLGHLEGLWAAVGVEVRPVTILDGVL